MRRLSPLLVLLFVTPALAETLDCAVIKSATHPFERSEEGDGSIVETRARHFDIVHAGRIAGRGTAMTPQPCSRYR